MTIRVALRDTPYDVHVGSGVRHQLAADLGGLVPRARVAAVVTTEALARQSWNTLALTIPTQQVVIDDGETAKTFDTIAQLCDAFASMGLSRHDVVIAIGGGATTDVVGFAAAVYLRGIAVIHVATSIAGQVDAAIGGKTAINIGAGKNLVGAFHQPKAVYCDLETLATLSEREMTAGMGEVAKCWLLERRPTTALASTDLQTFVELAVALKARIVARDEFELTGERALLNYGHTLGHAIELLALERDSDALRHGEAVAIGLRFAARLARHLELVGDDEVAYTDDVVDFFGLPRTVPFAMDIDALLAVMARDKKAHHSLTFVLPTKNGFTTVSDISEAAVRATYASFVKGE